MKRRLERRKRRRRILALTSAVVAAVIVVVGVYLGVSSQGQPSSSSYIGKPVPASVYSSLYQAANGPYGPANASVLSQFRTGQGAPYFLNGKPIVVYVGADWCPFCAAQRWPLALALMRFGNFSNLVYMQSSSTDVFPNSPTITFSDSKYTSDYVAYQPYEFQNRDRQPLQTVPSNYSSVWQQYGGGVPFIDIANKYVLPIASYSPALLNNKNWTQIVSEIQTNTPLGVQVKQVANAMTAEICKVTQGKPVSVCSSPSIVQLTSLDLAGHSASSMSFTTGIPNNTVQTWARVQYKQIE